MNYHLKTNWQPKWGKGVDTLWAAKNIAAHLFKTDPMTRSILIGRATKDGMLKVAQKQRDGRWEYFAEGEVK